MRSRWEAAVSEVEGLRAIAATSAEEADAARHAHDKTRETLRQVRSQVPSCPLFPPPPSRPQGNGGLRWRRCMRRRRSWARSWRRRRRCWSASGR